MVDKPSVDVDIMEILDIEMLDMLDKPSVDVDRLKLGSVAALVPEVALPPRRPDRADVVCTTHVVMKGSKMWSSNVDHRVCTRNVDMLIFNIGFSPLWSMRAK